MAADQNHICDNADEDYIDMEVSSNSNFFYQSISSPPHPREFEFQMFSSSSERETTTSPADELFYKGKLLPLHLPPRLQMVEKLLQNSVSYNHKNTDDGFEEHFSTPLTTTTYTTPTANTPFESCNISPSESCQVSRELNPDEYFFQYSTEVSGFIGDNPKKSWTRKLKLIKQSTIGSKLKASRDYLKSLFSKSGCSDESCAAAPRNLDEGSVSKTKEYVKMAKKTTPFGQIHTERYQMPNTTATRSFNKEKFAADTGARHRRSFSGAIKRFSTTKSSSSSSSSSGSSSSSSSSNSNWFHDSHFLKRSSSSVGLDIENSIQGAIAHCKRSQQEFHSRKTVNEIGFCSLSASRVVREDQERPGLCRG
ncbi:putative membrane-associated kinase regulator 4 [Camellia lanceoleosa]|uniref:Membrane-associated kinase regulator 4 n=1 Tax=Camellia lanceoleosa TaxID=1840588 RepID=A0ACC0J3Y2_9ERIC|nr:putative membrane-associated kinase regulator 4 [Camellia lanceoleosa]